MKLEQSLNPGPTISLLSLIFHSYKLIGTTVSTSKGCFKDSIRQFIKVQFFLKNILKSTLFHFHIFSPLPFSDTSTLYSPKASKWLDSLCLSPREKKTYSSDHQTLCTTDCHEMCAEMSHHQLLHFIKSSIYKTYHHFMYY